MKQFMTYLFKSLICFLLILFVSCDSYSQNKFKEQDAEFYNKFDGTKLSGTLTLPIEARNTPAVVLIHGSGPHNRDIEFGDHKLFKDLAEYLSSNGIAVLRYDKRGVGKSTGIFVEFDLENFKNDGIAGVDYLKTISSIDKSKIGVIGISEGGLVVPRIALSCPDIRFIVLLGSPGIWGKEFFYAYQLAVSKAAGFNQNDINQMTTAFNAFWPLVSKDRLSRNEEVQAKSMLKKIWDYTDWETRQDVGLVDNKLDFWFNIYHSDKLRETYNFKPKNVLSQLTCSVLALNGDKDVQAVSSVNLPAISEALSNGKCKDYKIIELKNHNHIFQICKTGKISEYKDIKGTMSNESLSIIGKWIKTTTKTE
jgi:pimeloyl-ACP methyl ester carboxylesterase